MTRIFVVLAWFAMLSLVTVTVVGLSLGDLRTDRSPENQHWGTIHRLSGVAAALGVVFVHSIVVTYFIGTSRWCKEVVETYGLDRDLIRTSTLLKRRTFPWALIAMLTVVGIIALGAAADPGALGPERSAKWAAPHQLAAFAGIAIIGWSMLVEWGNLHANHALIARVLEEVRRVRIARGLDVADSSKEA